MKLKKVTDCPFSTGKSMISSITIRFALASRLYSAPAERVTSLSFNVLSISSIVRKYALEPFWTASAHSPAPTKVLPVPDGDRNNLEELETVVTSLLDSCKSVPKEIIINHPGISPLAMQRLFEYFSSGKEPPEALFTPYATDTDAVAKYVILLKRLYNKLTNEFGDRDMHIFRQAIVTVHWMQGRSINRIISERKRAVPTEEIHSTIRTVLSDIETVARYKAPKFLSCYVSVR